MRTKIILIIIILIAILAISTYAQNIKIDNLSVSDYLAKEYFFDCIKNPDTLFSDDNPYIPKHANSYTLTKEISQWENDKTSRDINTDSLKPYICFYDKNGKWRGMKRGWIVYRDPSAQDFMKWYLMRYGKQYGN